VKLVGNIGNPVLDEIDFLEEFDYVVLELSSYMLDTLKKQNYISVLGSVFPDHLDRHGSFQAYAKAKLNVLNGSEYNVAHRKTIQECKLGEQLIAPSSSSNTHLISYGSE